MQRMIIIRGLPGSGKSDFAEWVSDLYYGNAWFEADQYFDLFLGGQLSPAALPRAHKWCQDQVENAALLGRDVIVSNTFTQEWEMEPYLEIAKKYNMRVTVLTVNNFHGNMSVHNVPEQTIEKMKARFQHKL